MLHDDPLAELFAYLHENQPWEKRHPKAWKALRIVGWIVAIPLAIVGVAATILWWAIINLP